MRNDILEDVADSIEAAALAKIGVGFSMSTYVACIAGWIRFYETGEVDWSHVGTKEEE